MYKDLAWDLSILIRYKNRFL